MTGRDAQLPPEARFWRGIEISDDGCWEWQGWLTPEGYGYIGLDGRTVPVHRYSYELLVRPIAEGLTIDHLCRNRRCVNPNHLEPVTERVNTLRGTSPSARYAARTHCARGHEYTAENTKIRRGKNGGAGSRICRACARLYHIRRRQRVTEAVS